MMKKANGKRNKIVAVVVAVLGGSGAALLTTAKSCVTRGDVSAMFDSHEERPHDGAASKSDVTVIRADVRELRDGQRQIMLHLGVPPSPTRID